MGAIKVDSDPVLENGTGTPYLAIFNGAKGAIRNPRDNMPIGELVTSFRYKYKEDGVDEGEFTIKTDNPDLPSLSTLQYNKTLILQWGYIYPSRSPLIGPPRSVIIVDQQITWGQDGVTLKIGFAARGILTKNIPSTWRQQEKEWDTYAQVMKDIVDKGKVVGTKLVDLNQKVVESHDVILQLQKDANPGEEYEHIATSNTFPKQSNSAAMSEKAYKANTKHIYEFLDESWAGRFPNAKKVINIYDSNDPEAVDQLTNYIESNDKDYYFTKGTVCTIKSRSAIFTGAEKTRWNQLESIADNLQNGPYNVSARDDAIVIKNRNLNRPVSKVYTYCGGNGELLIFKIQNKFTVNYTEIVEDADIDPDTKNERVVVGQNISDPDQGMYVITNEDKRNFEHARDKTRFKSGVAPQDGSSITGYNQIDSAGIQTVYTETYFDSTQDAIEYFQNNPGFTQEEFDSLIQQIQETIKTKMYGPDDWERCTDFDYFDNYTIKRKVKIKSTYDLARFYGEEGSKFERNITFASNGGIGGYVKDFQNGYAAKNNIQVLGVVPEAHVNNQLNTTEGFIPIDQYLSDPDSYSMSMTPGVVTVQEQEITVPLHATQIRANRPSGIVSNQIGNDLQKSLDVSVKANATIIGDPGLEDSMNLYIQNISSKYSGVWYTTEVEHSFSISGGYLCYVTFIQRDISMSSSIIKSSINLGEKALEDQLSAKESLKSGAYKIPNACYYSVREQARKAGGGPEGNTLKTISAPGPTNLMMAQNPDNLGMIDTYRDNMVDGENDTDYGYQPNVPIANFLTNGERPENLIEMLNRNNPSQQ